ncbi:MAG: hypothetical protein FWC64_06975 [Treponema sp.]|nr:hypothetical protein [Treponema sp.]
MPRLKKPVKELKARPDAVRYVEKKAKEKQKKARQASPEVGEYLLKTQELLDMLWVKLQDKELLSEPGDYKKYIDMFMAVQRHYFSFAGFVPKQENEEESLESVLG